MLSDARLGCTVGGKYAVGLASEGEGGTTSRTAGRRLALNMSAKSLASDETVLMVVMAETGE